MEASKILIPIKIEDIYPHPDNPRKEIGDISEMIDSVKKNGIMQNLSVIPGHYVDRELVEGGYTLIIGHRRFEAAKKAGLREVPCRVVKESTLKEQVGIMLEENMQRHDLTIIEQAEGFQLMLDLGETEESIAQKTGFSKQTVRHRVNLAKLDKKILKEANEREEFQLNLKDLYELEKIKDINKRNTILELADNSNDIAWEVERAIRDEKVAENEEIVKKMLEKAEITEAPSSANNELYSGKWKRHIEIALDKDIPTELEAYKGMKYIRSKWRDEYIIIEPQEIKPKEPTKLELEQKARDEAQEVLKGVHKSILRKFKTFAKLAIDEKIEIKEDIEAYQTVSKLLIDNDTYIMKQTICKFITGKTVYDLKADNEAFEQYQEKIKTINPLMQLIICIMAADYSNCFTWKLEYDKEKGEKMAKIVAFAQNYGFDLTDEEFMYICGSHEKYFKEPEKGK